MKKLLFLFLLFIPLVAFCQTEEKQYYLYNIVSFEGTFTKEDFKVYYDDGTEVKRLRDDKGEKMKFKMAQVPMYKGRRRVVGLKLSPYHLTTISLPRQRLFFERFAFGYRHCWCSFTLFFSLNSLSFQN